MICPKGRKGAGAGPFAPDAAPQESSRGAASVRWNMNRASEAGDVQPAYLSAYIKMKMIANTYRAGLTSRPFFDANFTMG